MLHRNRCALWYMTAACLSWGMFYSLVATAQTSAPKPTSVFQDISRRADSARETGDVPTAIQLYGKGLRLNPAWQEGLWYLGSLEYDGSHYAEAATALRKLTTLNPKMSAAWALLGLSEFETSNFSQSFSHLQRARELGSPPELARVTEYHMALLLNLRGEFEKAGTVLSQLVLQGVNSEDVQVGLGLSLLRVPLLPAQLDPSKDALIHDAGNVGGFLAHREFERADVGFRDLLKKYPRTPFVHYAYGTALAAHGKEEEAEAQFREETTVTPESGLAYTEWAFLELHNQHYEAALPLARNAVKLAPQSSMSRFVLGSILLAQNELAPSISELETARRLAPSSPEIRYSISRAYAKAGRSEESRRERAEFARLQSKTKGAENEDRREDVNGREAIPPTDGAIPSTPQPPQAVPPEAIPH